MTTRMKIVLGVSLALNLFLVGAGIAALTIGAHMLRDRMDTRRGDGQRVAAAFQALPPERREALREIMRARAMTAAPDMREAAEARREAARLIAAPSYDAAAVTKALSRARDAENRGRAKVDATLAERLTQLNAEERARFARLLVSGPGRGGRGPNRRGPGRDGPDGPPPPPGAPGPER